jgi:hypothetical protein
MAIKVKRPGVAAAGADESAALGSSAWEDAPTEFTRRVVFMRIYGDTGTGRTSLALTAPGPIGLCHTAEKLDGIVQRFAREKVIRMANFAGTFRGSAQDIANQANAIWSRVQGAWFDGLDNWARTVVMDTDTEGWELIRLARFGELNPRGRTDSLYGPVNAEWRSLFKRFRAQDRCNVISIGQTKDEYREFIKNGQKSSERTGRTIMAGMKEMSFMSDVVIRTDRKPDGGFIATIEKGWFNAHTEGMTFENEDIRFSYIMSLITETDEAEWI